VIFHPGGGMRREERLLFIFSSLFEAQQTTPYLPQVAFEKSKVSIQKDNCRKHAPEQHERVSTHRLYNRPGKLKDFALHILDLSFQKCFATHGCALTVDHIAECLWSYVGC